MARRDLKSSTPTRISVFSLFASCLSCIGTKALVVEDVELGSALGSILSAILTSGVKVLKVEGMFEENGNTYGGINE